MEKMPFHASLDELAGSDASARTSPGEASNWRECLPSMPGAMVLLRELELRDAPSLLAMLSVAEVARFISPPPTTIEGFETFIAWARKQREAGDCICFAVVPQGLNQAIGVFQVRRLDATFETAEWGFAIGSAFWGTGVFIEAGRLVLDFAFKTVKVRRLEARAAVANGRGNGALRKIGAVQEGVLRGSFLRNGEYLDQVLWSILDVEWLRATSIHAPMVRTH